MQYASTEMKITSKMTTNAKQIFCFDALSQIHQQMHPSNMPNHELHWGHREA